MRSTAQGQGLAHAEVTFDPETGNQGRGGILDTGLAQLQRHLQPDIGFGIPQQRDACDGVHDSVLQFSKQPANVQRPRQGGT